MRGLRIVLCSMVPAAGLQMHRGFLDAVVLPYETRAAPAPALRTSLNNPGPHLGAFVPPPNV
jgi:hypothetical protein